MRDKLSSKEPVASINEQVHVSVLLPSLAVSGNICIVCDRLTASQLATENGQRFFYQDAEAKTTSTTARRCNFAFLPSFLDYFK